MESIESRVNTIALNHGYDVQELYVHIPAGNYYVPHIELEGDFADRVPSELNKKLMNFVDIEDKQPSTKHKLLDVLKENK